MKLRRITVVCVQDVNEKLIRELREEIERLRVMVQGQQSGIQVPGSTAETPGMSDQMEEMIANLERAKQGVSFVIALH
jgi:hypothetical protein